MTDMNIKLTVTYNDKVSAGAKSSARAISDIDKAAASTTSKMDGFKSALMGVAVAAGAMAAAFATARKVYDFAKEGAAIEFTAIKFDRLAATFGTTGDALRSDLLPAMDGLVSKAEAMELATTIMTLGLTKTADQTVRLAGVASQLGMNMNQLVLTLTNRTTARFDQLGVAVDGFDEKVQALIATGMSAEDAFTEAFLQQAEEQIEKVGSISETTAGKIQQMESAWKDVVDAWKLVLANSVGLEGGLLDTVTAWARLIEHVQNGNVSMLEANFGMLVAAVTGAKLTTIVGNLDNEFTGVKLSLESYTPAIEDATDATRQFGDQAQLTKYRASELSTPLQNLTADFSELAGQLTGELNTGLSGFIDNMIELAELEAGGWAEIQLAVANTMAMYEQGNISLEEYKELLMDAKLEAEAIAGTFDGMTTDQIAWWINKELGIPLEQARLMAENINGEVDMLDGSRLENFKSSLGDVNRSFSHIDGSTQEVLKGLKELDKTRFPSFAKHLDQDVRDPLRSASETAKSAKSTIDKLNNQKFNQLPGAIKRGVEMPLESAQREIEKLIKGLDDADGRVVNIEVRIKKSGGDPGIIADARAINSPRVVSDMVGIGGTGRSNDIGAKGIQQSFDSAQLQAMLASLPRVIARETANAVFTRREMRVG